MLRSLDNYLDQAKAAAGIGSDNELGRRLGFKSNIVCLYRTKRSWPSDDAMIRIAEMAGENPDIALCQLSAWRNAGPAANRWQTMAGKLAAITADQMAESRRPHAKNKPGTGHRGEAGDCILWKIQPARPRSMACPPEPAPFLKLTRRSIP